MYATCTNSTKTVLTHPDKVGQSKESDHSSGRDKRKGKSIVTLSVLLLIIVLFATVANAAIMMSVYSTSLSFQYYYNGPTRTYTGSSTSEDMHWKGTTHVLNQTNSMSTTFTISLYRERKLLPDELIGSVTCSRDGYHDIVWTNVGAGKYYFYYTKASDGATVYSNDVILSMS